MARTKNSRKQLSTPAADERKRDPNLDSNGKPIRPGAVVETDCGEIGFVEVVHDGAFIYRVLKTIGGAATQWCNGWQCVQAEVIQEPTVLGGLVPLPSKYLAHCRALHMLAAFLEHHWQILRDILGDDGEFDEVLSRNAMQSIQAAVQNIGECITYLSRSPDFDDELYDRQVKGLEGVHPPNDLTDLAAVSRILPGPWRRMRKTVAAV
jgi:hypothetical protein